MLLVLRPYLPHHFYGRLACFSTPARISSLLLRAARLFLDLRPYFYTAFTGGLLVPRPPPVFATLLLQAAHLFPDPRPYFLTTFTGEFPHAYSPPVFPHNLYRRIPPRLLPARIFTLNKGISNRHPLFVSTPIYASAHVL